MGAIIEESGMVGNPLAEMHIGRPEVAIAKCGSDPAALVSPS